MSMCLRSLFVQSGLMKLSDFFYVYVFEKGVSEVWHSEIE